MTILNIIKTLFLREYNMKNFEKIKTIIKWQIIREPLSNIMKIDQSIFIQDLIIDKNLSDYNANIFSIKIVFTINITEADIYKKENLYIY